MRGAGARGDSHPRVPSYSSTVTPGHPGRACSAVSLQPWDTEGAHPSCTGEQMVCSSPCPSVSPAVPGDICSLPGQPRLFSQALVLPFS